MVKRRNGKLFSVDISLQHAFKKEDCSGEMLISCQIGTKYIEVQRKQFNTCPVTACMYAHYVSRYLRNILMLLVVECNETLKRHCISNIKKETYDKSRGINFVSILITKMSLLTIPPPKKKKNQQKTLTKQTKIKEKTNDITSYTCIVTKRKYYQWNYSTNKWHKHNGKGGLLAF